MKFSRQVWVDGLTIGRVLEITAQRNPENEAIVFPQLEYRLNYREFHQAACEVARAFISLGVPPGAHIGVWATNWPQWILIQFACGLSGNPLVNINPAYRLHELEYVLRQAEITTLLLTGQFKTSNYFGMLGALCPELETSAPGNLSARRFPLLRRIVSIQDNSYPGILSWSGFLGLSKDTTSNELENRQQKIQAEDVANIQYTSGTTGFPKGVQLTHRNLLLNSYHVGARMRVSSADRVCIPVPFYHCFGCVMGTLMCSVYGAAMIVPGETFDAAATLATVESEKCTALYGVPAMFISELNSQDFSKFDLGSLRTGIMAGSPCPIEIMKRVVDDMGIEQITIAYGLTEASPVVTQTQVGDSIEHRVATVGTPLPGVEVKIVNPSTTETLPVGQQGELLVRGHGVMKGYFNLPAETREAISSDGWLHTGDLATETPDGHFKITGRIKDMIIRGGENIYPREIEEFLYTHPSIHEVQVVGLPDEKLGEAISAWIVVKPGHQLDEKSVREFCTGRIAHFKIPKYIVFVDNYPTTVTGKIQKFRLQEMGIAHFQLEKAAEIKTA